MRGVVLLHRDVCVSPRPHTHALLRDSHVAPSLGNAPGPQARELEMMLHQPLAQHRPSADF